MTANDLTTTLTFRAEKKHSIRYDNPDDSAAIKSIYVMKDFMLKPYPREVKITLEFEP